jgi:hypothetical protein
MSAMHPAETKVGRRDDQRARVNLAARIVTVAGTRFVRINNLSRGGAAITGETPLKRGADVVLRWSGIEAFASVTWVAGCRCGLMFDEPISDEAVLIARSLSDHRESQQRAEQRTVARDFAHGVIRLGLGD